MITGVLAILLIAALWIMFVQHAEITYLHSALDMAESQLRHPANRPLKDYS